MIINANNFLQELSKTKINTDAKKHSQPGMLAIQERLDKIYSIVFEKKDMIFLQKSYSYIRPFTDSYQEAIDFFETSEGKEMIELFNYFSYQFEVPNSQIKGYNIDPNFKES